MKTCPHCQIKNTDTNTILQELWLKSKVSCVSFVAVKAAISKS